jgi:FAD/FMN-containing dehydrogenase
VPAPTAQTSATTGWRLFAGTILLLLGVMNLIDGIIAVVDPDLFEQNLAGSPTLAVIDRIEAWGWLVLITGIALVVISFPVMTRVVWARGAGIAAAGIDLVLQFTYLAHFAPWSMTLILLDVMVIFALAADRGGRR